MSGFQQKITWHTKGQEDTMVVKANKHQNKTQISHSCWNSQSGIENNDQYIKNFNGKTGQHVKTDG